MISKCTTNGSKIKVFFGSFSSLLIWNSSCDNYFWLLLISQKNNSYQGNETCYHYKNWTLLLKVDFRQTLGRATLQSWRLLPRDFGRDAMLGIFREVLYWLRRLLGSHFLCYFSKQLQEKDISKTVFRITYKLNQNCFWFKITFIFVSSYFSKQHFRVCTLSAQFLVKYDSLDRAFKKLSVPWHLIITRWKIIKRDDYTNEGKMALF